MGSEERARHVGAGRPIDDEAAGRRQRERQEDAAAPLPGRHPHLTGARQQRHEREVRRIEDVPAAHAQDELAGDGHDGREGGEAERAGAEQQTERERRDERAAEVGRAPGQPRAEMLGDERAGDDRERREGADLEVEPDDAVDEERAERGDLVEPRVPRARGGRRHGPVERAGRRDREQGRHARLDRRCPRKFPGSAPGHPARISTGRGRVTRTRQPPSLPAACLPSGGV